MKNSSYIGINNFYIVIFDIYGEYKIVFLEVNYIDIYNFVLFYWFLNSEELEELFIEIDVNDYN